MFLGNYHFRSASLRKVVTLAEELFAPASGLAGVEGSSGRDADGLRESYTLANENWKKMPPSDSNSLSVEWKIFLQNKSLDGCSNREQDDVFRLWWLCNVILMTSLWCFWSKKLPSISWVLVHGIKSFVLPTKSFVKIGITEIFCCSDKTFSFINITFGCSSKIFGCSNKKFICCP